jgi:molybdopterin synthase catalytic subunit
LDVVLLPRFAVVAGPLSLDGLAGAVRAAHRGGIGAVATFAGLVRGENLGRSVTHLDYEAYEPLAVKSFTRIAEEIAAEWPDATVGVHHRVGRVEIAEASIVIVAVSAHRAAAFAACRYVIERVKQIAPVWRHEHFDGGDVWIEGATAQPDDDGARAEARRRACA